MPGSSRGRSPSPQRSRSVLSKFKAPFSSKTRNISEFYIQPDDPHRQYSPGDIITGSVVLKVIKPLRITHLVCCLHGYVQVYKTPNNPGENYRSYQAALASGKTRKTGGYYGNGFMSLFKDEVVLCGDGRLGESTYQFNFELEFPRERLPSSIDFERGTISYLITATLTRPTTIAPTMSCDHPISYQEGIDIAALYKPKPRVISLEPIPRRSRTRRKPTRRPDEVEQKGKEQKRESGSSNPDGRAVLSDVGSKDTENPQSPSPSIVSFSSEPSSGGTGSVVDSNSVSARTNDSKLGWEKSVQPHSHRRQQPITASIELMEAGFLRGDSVQVKINVQHTKQIKSLHGVIVTFYRQARVDPHPPLPKVGSSKKEEDELIPRSKTGLGGLSMGPGGSSHLYRKDLSQSFSSLIVNPSTLTAEVKATVRVPEGAFPTISTVPGAMISFKYYVEVVLDLQGKLAGIDRFLPNVGMAGVSAPNLDGSMGLSGDGSHSVFAPWGGHFINTEEIRRDKSVVSCTFEVIIGTKDSERKGRWRSQLPTDPEPSDDATIIEGNGAYPAYSEDGTQDSYEVPSIPRPTTNGYVNSYYDAHPDIPDEPPPPIHAYPIPDLAAEEEHLPEKERMRRREERLLPSRPPGDGVESSSAGAEHATSAPPADFDGGHPAVPQLPPEAHEPSAPPLDDLYAEPEDGPSAPAYHEHHPPGARASSSGIGANAATDDKQELQRRRLEIERSAPPLDEDPPATAGASAPSATSMLRDEQETGPTAPTIEDLTLGFSQSTIHDPHLPRYER